MIVWSIALKDAADVGLHYQVMKVFLMEALFINNGHHNFKKIVHAK